MKLATDERAVIARITRWASADDRVRAALLTSSRADPNAPVDLLSDYDIALIVSDPDALARDERWVSAFGRPLLRVRDVEERAGLLVQNAMVLYDDGTKIDYSLWPLTLIDGIIARGVLPAEFDGGFRVLLDKDDLTRDWPPPSHTAYIPAKPTAQEFQALVEEFWWVATYVAKNLWRGELLTARILFDQELKYLVLRRLLEWRIEIDGDWHVQPGLFARRLPRQLDAGIWEELRATYGALDREGMWEALFQTGALFRRVASDVARDLGFVYPRDLDDQVSDYLRQIQRLEPRPDQ
jgi:aminoglycoside 6-adenylyltransferase